MASTKETYRDGTGAIRCSTCLSELKTPDHEPLVMMRLSDVQNLACCLEEYVNCPEVWGETIKRLEQLCGQTTDQMRAALAKT